MSYAHDLFELSIELLIKGSVVNFFNTLLLKGIVGNSFLANSAVISTHVFVRILIGPPVIVRFLSIVKLIITVIVSPLILASSIVIRHTVVDVGCVIILDNFVGIHQIRLIFENAVLNWRHWHVVRFEASPKLVFVLPLEVIFF